MLESIWQDLRFAARSLRKTPGFTLIVLITLVAGIASVTAIFSYANAAYMADLPYRDAHRILPMGHTRGYNVPQASATAVRLVRDNIRSFERIGVFRSEYTSIVTENAARPVRVLQIDTGFAAVIGLRPQLGRLPGRDEIIANAPVALISDRLWRSQYGTDSSIVGRSIEVLGRHWQIIGVTPPAWDYPYSTSIVMPMPDLPVVTPGTIEDEPDWTILGKLRPDVTREAAVAELKALSARMPKYPRRVSWGTTLYAQEEILDRRAYQFLPYPMVFIGMGIFVLLIACANVANLFLARGVERRGVIAVRASLGATRGRLIRELLMEALILGSLAAMLGTTLSSLLVKLALGALPTEQWPGWFRVTLDWRVLLFALGALLLVTIAVGLSPALEGTKLDLARALKAGGAASGSTTPISRSISRGLTIQLALSVALFVCSALLVRTYHKVASIDLGYPAARIATVAPMFDRIRYKDPLRSGLFLEEIADGLRQMPGVRHVAVSGRTYELRTAFTVKRTEQEKAELLNDYRLIPDRDSTRGIRLPQPGVIRLAVSDDYFKVLGLRVREGRGFIPEDRETSAGVTVISAAVAQRIWPKGNALGHTLQLGRAGEPLIVIGIVDDVHRMARMGDVAEASPSVPEFMMYVSMRQAVPWYPQLIAIGDGNVSALRTAMLARVRAADPALVIGRDQTLASTIETHLLVLRVFGGAIFFFGFVGLALSVIGIYGVVSFGVARKTREIGVRIALGGTDRDVLAYIMSGTTRFTMLGLIIGLALAMAFSRFLAFILVGTSPLDPVAYAAVCLLFAVVALIATYLPARKATRVDPLVALRSE